MSDVTLSYKGSDILELSDSGSATLKTGGKYCEDDIAVEYVKPSGGGGEWTTDGLADRSEPNGALTIRTTNIADYAFYGNEGITSVNAPNATSIGNGAFNYCTGITSFVAPNLISVSGSQFIGRAPIESVIFPKLSTLSTSAFQWNKVRVIVLPSVTALPNSCFVSGNAARVIDIGENCVSIGTQCFNSANMLETLILRSTSVVSLANVNAFQNTPFVGYASKSGTLYVPQALISSYQSATNWSTILSNANNQILPIEGSQYETHYADGTEITS